MVKTILLVLACIAFSPNIWSISPAPDGGYPGGNTAEGQNALFSLTTGGYNTAVGYFSLTSDTTTSFNTAIGAGALLANTGNLNTATGAGTLLSSNGNFNTANGALALFYNTEGWFNTAIGYRALENNTEGNNNIALGVNTLISNTTGNFNVALGYFAGIGVHTASNVICIGATGADVDNTFFIGNVRGTTTVNNDAMPVVIDSAGQLGTLSSSKRFKKEIRPMDKASEAILALKPVTFHYKSDKTSRPEFGLIAEQVAEVNPALVVRDKNREIYTVRYDAVNAMLLNEFLKEHRKVEQQAHEIQEQKDTITDLTEGLATVIAQQKQQASQIEKMSADLKLYIGATQTTANNK